MANVPCRNPKLCKVKSHLPGTQALCQTSATSTQNSVKGGLIGSAPQLAQKPSVLGHDHPLNPGGEWGNYSTSRIMNRINEGFDMELDDDALNAAFSEYVEQADDPYLLKSPVNDLSLAMVDNWARGRNALGGTTPAQEEPKTQEFKLSPEAEAGGMAVISKGDWGPHMQAAWDAGFRPIFAENAQPGAYVLSIESIKEREYDKSSSNKIERIDWYGEELDDDDPDQGVPRLYFEGGDYQEAESLMVLLVDKESVPRWFNFADETRDWE